MAYVRTTELPESRNPAGVAAGEKRPRLAQTGRARGGWAPRLEDVVGPVLRYGSLLSVAIILVGGAMLAWSLPALSRELLVVPTVGSQPTLYPPAELPSRLRGGDPMAMMSLGLLVLIATPVVRVASTVLFFLWKRDRAYLAITAFVLAVILAGFVVGSR